MTYWNVYPNTKKWSVKPVFSLYLHIPTFKANHLLRKEIMIIKKAVRLLKPGAYHKAHCGWAIWRIMNLEPMTVAAYSIVFLNESFYLLLYASFAMALVWGHLSPDYTHCGTSSWVKHRVQAGPTYLVPMKTFYCKFALIAVKLTISQELMTTVFHHWCGSCTSRGFVECAFFF